MSKYNSPHFLGFTAQGDEKTNNEVDLREVFDFATGTPGKTKYIRGPTDRDYNVLVGQNQWPDPNVVGTDFQDTIMEYMSCMRDVYRGVLTLLESALGLPRNSLLELDSPSTQHRLKLVKYFPTRTSYGPTGSQGVGAHQDETGWLTFVNEVDKPGLQVHMRNGTEWLEVPIGKNGWGLNVGKAFERATCSLIHATLHRVQSPPANSTPRHSIVFFAGLPLEQSYTSLQAIFAQSKILMAMKHRDDNLSSTEYLQELGKLVVGEGADDTFGSSQLSMWQRSYNTKPRAANATG
ncbi:uncharacterized protein K452DRAFT_301160 [Aplosporella prunicola CBS 121167]|uniref:Fe2OG dioxygenase domain-containing protein n=1 Tax=Aplosporella prunicola CBS 121167 TaxID=1176127 RepID=A0A6A6B5Y8_9PEZI|nr:uncharacterized protein K452DRAFT_301160 [Aplosporella prunicola CBS 121167]KAF2138191.1 hypothetical protein K452DRAFT_301160 [Aplosporella prunicola CBS 121167]